MEPQRIRLHNRQRGAALGKYILLVLVLVAVGIIILTVSTYFSTRSTVDEWMTKMPVATKMSESGLKRMIENELPDQGPILVHRDDVDWEQGGDRVKITIRYRVLIDLRYYKFSLPSKFASSYTVR